MRCVLRIGMALTLLAAAATGPGCPRGPSGAPATPPSPAAGDGPAEAPSVVPGRVRVVVRDFAGAPVAGAQVAARVPRPWDRGGWPGMGETTALGDWPSLPPSWDLGPRVASATDADGRATLAGLAPGPWSISVDAPGRVRRAVAHRVEAVGADGSPAEVEIRAEPGHAFTGRVLTAAGVPVPGALVLAEYAGIAPGGRIDDVLSDFATARADSEGRFRFDALPAALVNLSCGPPGAWSNRCWTVRVPSVASLDLRMDTRGPVEGRVEALPDGKPVAGAQVVFSVATFHEARVTACATTGPDGRYSIPVYPGDGVMDISVASAGFDSVPMVRDARQPPFRLHEDRPTAIDLLLRPDTDEYADVRGVVRGPDGPVAAARVSLSSCGGDAWMSRIATSDAAGRFRIFGVAEFLRGDVGADHEEPRASRRAPGPGAPAAPRVLVVTCDARGLYLPGWSALGADGAPPPEPGSPGTISADTPRPVDLDIVMARGGRITGRVLGEDGRPVGGAEVRSRGGVMSTSSADGTFVLEGLDEPGETTVSASTGDGRLAGESAKFRAGVGEDATGVEVRLTAQPPRRRQVVVTGRVHPSDATAAMRDARVADHRAWVPIGPAGDFRVEVARSEGVRDISLTATLPGWGEREIRVAVPPTGQAADAGDVEIAPFATIRGRVTDAKGPVAGAWIGLERSSDSGVVFCGFFEGPSPAIVAVTGADGAFEATCIAGEDYDVHAEFPGHVEERRTVRAADVGAECSFQLAREAFLRGRVTRRDGRPVAGASVEARLPSAQWGGDYGDTDSDGRFAIRVREGFSYVVEARLSLGEDEGPDAFPATTSGPHAPGGEPIEIVVSDGLVIRGRVVYAGGDAVAGATVSGDPRGVRQTNSRETTTAPDGSFTLQGLLDCPHRLRVVAGLADVIVLSDVAAGREDVEVNFPVPTVIAGVLLDEDGKPASAQSVAATRMVRASADRDAQIEAVTDAEGRFRLVGAGPAPCRIELVREGDRWGGGGWPLVAGVGVAPGSKDVVLRIASRAATSIAGRAIDDAGRPFEGFSVTAQTRPGHGNETTGDVSGSQFEFSRIRLEEACEVVAEFAGLYWKLAVPPGTRDLVFTAGADGLHKVEFGGRVHEAFPVEFRIQEGRMTTEYASVRLVHPVTGAVVPTSDLRSSRGYKGRARVHGFVDVTVGPWRVEAREHDDAPWRVLRPRRVFRGVVLVQEE